LNEIILQLQLENAPRVELVKGRSGARAIMQPLAYDHDRFPVKFLITIQAPREAYEGVLPALRERYDEFRVVRKEEKVFTAVAGFGLDGKPSDAENFAALFTKDRRHFNPPAPAAGPVLCSTEDRTSRRGRVRVGPCCTKKVYKKAGRKSNRKCLTRYDYSHRYMVIGGSQMTMEEDLAAAKKRIMELEAELAGMKRLQAPPPVDRAPAGATARAVELLQAELQDAKRDLETLKAKLEKAETTRLPPYRGGFKNR
jgi:hypothetical protein